MTIVIYNNGEQITLDNNSPMVDKGKIAYGSINNDVFLDGMLTKKEASDMLDQIIKTFLEPKKKKVI